VLVSEVMLQQTQADRVVPYYRDFLAAFPTPTACAGAGAAAVVRAWSGLGYNRRALNLHRAATVMVAEHQGHVPSDEGALRALPGVGPYTANAIRSFAYGADVATVDVNAVRVLARSMHGAGLTVPEAQALADRLLPAGRSWDFNQTMFDLGATVCLPRPRCGQCPLLRMCRWHQSGLDQPDPWRASPSSRPQSPFAGSDRQGRGRLVQALRTAAVAASDLGPACGWPDEPDRADRIAADLVAEGFARWSPRSPRRLQLCR
jgi:A/G-specific adenine glycosylase